MGLDAPDFAILLLKVWVGAVKFCEQENPFPLFLNSVVQAQIIFCKQEGLMTMDSKID